jgi:hypothetical protein
VESLKALTPERISLKPVNQAEQYSPSGINKITFRLPAFSNSFLNTSKSFLTYTLGYNTTTPDIEIDKDNCCVPVNGANFIQRLVTKTSAGLVIDDIGSYNVLTAINLATLPMGNAYNYIEGRSKVSQDIGTHSGTYSVFHDIKGTGKQFRHQIQAGVLSKHTEKLIPVGMADAGSGYCFDVDLYLADTSSVIKQIGTVAAPGYFVKDVVYHLELLRADESLCKKFNEISCSDDKEILIPFSTMHNHQHLITNDEQNLVRIHESATNLKRIFSVYLISADLATLVLNRAYTFTGLAYGYIEKFNCRVGSKWLFNEPVSDAAEAVMHLKNSLGYQDTSLICEQASESGGDITYANMNKFVQCVDFGYTNEKFLDGISSNTPIEIIVETRPAYVSGTVMMHSFTEMNYNLSIKKGVVTYVEPKPGVGNVY